MVTRETIRESERTRKKIFEDLLEVCGERVRLLGLMVDAVWSVGLFVFCSMFAV